jgi:uncharacterized zinc-type alcohol dehydrogenase-like protein
VGVIGIGGLGHLAIKFARAMGAEVTAFSTSADKEKEAKDFGAHHFCQWDNAEEIENFSGKQDLIISTSSSAIDWDKCFNLLANNGVFCILGLPTATLNIPLLPLVFGQKAIVGSVVGGRRFMREMLEFAAINQIKPMIEIMELSDINAAMDKVAENKARYRIVLVSEH